MNAIQIRKRIESETLHLPELRELIGKSVQIIILEETEQAETPLETRETFFGRRPERARSAEENQAEREQLSDLAKTNLALAAALAIASAGGPDVDAVIAERARG